MKIPDCDRCSLYARNPHLICTVHPNGVDGDRCLDFRPDPNIKPEERVNEKRSGGKENLVSVFNTITKPQT